MVSQVIAQFRITAKLGEGGMGEVYLAEDTKLNRNVALKCLPRQWEQNVSARERLIREARAAAAIDHPFVCNIHEIVEDQGRTFIVMEYIEGEPLSERLRRGSLPIEVGVGLAAEITEAVRAAHQHGIVHRDLKPGNIMLTRDGHVKVMDFGIAKWLDTHQTDSDSTTVANLTEPGATPGSPAYMSPEQIKGTKVDTRSDIFSAGILFCQVFCGRNPFQRATPSETRSSILDESPTISFAQDSPVARRLKALVTRMLAKDSALRCQTMDEVLKVLQQCREEQAEPRTLQQLSSGFGRMLLRPVVGIPLLAGILLIGMLVFRSTEQSKKRIWAKETALPDLRRHAEREQFREAFRLATEVQKLLPDDPELKELWPKISTIVSVNTTPPGAAVYVKDYANVQADWTYLGTAPLQQQRLSRQPKRFRYVIEGYQEVEMARFYTPWVSSSTNSVELQSAKTAPSGMVHLPAGNYWIALTGLDHLNTELPGFSIDRYELSNRQYAEFVRNGGYQNRLYWKQKFIKDGVELSFDEAMRRFVDKTGRPGPASWELSDYPTGEEGYPVRGVSWFEAAAYAEFAGKSLPTVHHWAAAAGAVAFDLYVPLSNFRNQGPWPVTQSQAMSRYGVCDLAGNVKEWCWNVVNEKEDKRYILGGAWDEPTYMANDLDVQSPWNRLPNYGFRCLKDAATNGLSPELFAPIPAPFRDYAKEVPVSDETFEIYRRFYAYDKTALKPTTDGVDDTAEHWRREKVSFETAYGNERGSAYFFIPKNVKPPYQAVIYFPGSGALRTRSSESLQLFFADFVVRSGRVVVYPIFKSTYERGDGLLSDRPNMTRNFRDHVIWWYQDLARTIDFLETREDIQKNKIGYLGFSWGGVMGAIVPALENRIQVSVLVVSGFWQQRGPPETEQINFAPRVKSPVLMLNGRYDAIFQVESSQLPMFRHLGTLEPNKKHILYDTGHWIPVFEAMKETLNWFDRYLGPVTPKNASAIGP